MYSLKLLLHPTSDVGEFSGRISYESGEIIYIYVLFDMLVATPLKKWDSKCIDILTLKWLEEGKRYLFF